MSATACSNMFRPLAEKKNIDLRSQIDPGLPTLRQDLTKLQQILQNLLSNAIKFTPEGGRVLAQGRRPTRGTCVSPSSTPASASPRRNRTWCSRSSANRAIR